MTVRPLPRRLHAGTWWLWAIGLGAAATATTNPILLALILAVVALVVAARGSAGPGAAFRGYLMLALVVIALRVAFRVVFGGGFAGHVVFTLPRLPLPDWAAGVVIGGPVTAEALLAAFADGMRLATIVVCVGAANTLADPRRLLRSLPRALYDTAAAAIVALSVAPQVIESIGRVRRARRLRGNPGTGLRSVRSLLAPVLEGALGRSLALAAGMESRGYGRLGPAPTRRRRLGTTLGLTGVTLLSIGTFSLVDGALAFHWAIVVVAGGLGAGAGAVAAAGGTVGRTIYRPERWGVEGWLVGASGVAAAVAVWASGWIDPTALAVSVQPLGWPALPSLAAAGILAAGIPAWVAPPAPATPDALVASAREVTAP